MHTLVQELKEAFKRESAKTGKPRLLLSAAVPAGKEVVEAGYDVPALAEYLSFYSNSILLKSKVILVCCCTLRWNNTQDYILPICKVKLDYWWRCYITEIHDYTCIIVCSIKSSMNCFEAFRVHQLDVLRLFGIWNFINLCFYDFKAFLFHQLVIFWLTDI